MKILKEVSLADSLSVLNALLGFSAITNVILYGLSNTSFALFYFSLIVDGLDGLVASKTERSPIGKELDSLADSISFGVFPALTLIKYNPNLFPFAALLVASTILRLARFNILSFENFIGVPTTVNALLVTSLIRLNFETNLIALATFISSILMISDFEYPKIKNKPFLLVSAIVLVFAIHFVFLCYLIVIASVAYMILPREVTCRWKRREERLLKLE